MEHEDVPTGRLTWIGNATVLIEVGGVRILTDPNFLHQGQHAKLGGGLRSRRLVDPAAELTELLPIDLVVLSHHHGDHFDEVAARDLPADTPIVTTAHAARKLARQGFTRLHVLQTWQATSWRRADLDLVITGLPGRHAPQPLRAVLPPVMGSMLDLRVGAWSYRLYVTGDTLMFRELREIPARFPGIDLAAVHLGGTRVLGVLLTMDGEQGAEALSVVDPDVAIPIHYEEYTVMRSPLSEFTEEVGRRQLRTRIHRLDRGGTYEFALRRR